MAKADATKVDLYFVRRELVRRRSTYIFYGENRCDECRLYIFYGESRCDECRLCIFYDESQSDECRHCNDPGFIKEPEFFNKPELEKGAGIFPMIQNLMKEPEFFQ